MESHTAADVVVVVHPNLDVVAHQNAVVVVVVETGGVCVRGLVRW